MGEFLLSLTKESSDSLEGLCHFCFTVGDVLTFLHVPLSDWGPSVLGEVAVATVTGDKSSVFSR